MSGSKEEVWTVASILAKAAGYLREKGVESPRLDAEILLTHVLDVDRVQLYTRHNRPLIGEELESYRSLLGRRAQEEPTAYLVGRKEFYSLEFFVGPGVLIPRPETEFLVATAIEKVKGKNGPSKAADIGTGSGCVAVALAVYAPDCEVFATERSTIAAGFARRNAASHNVHERVTIAEGEFFEPLRRMGFEGKLDVVVSNPPYIAEGEFENLPATVRDYEPREALVAGPTGTECHEAIALDAPEFLVPGGILAMEVGAGQCARVRRALGKTGAYGEPETVRDYGGVERVIVAKRK